MGEKSISPKLVDSQQINTINSDQLNQWFDARFEEKIKQHYAQKKKSLAIIATKGTLDWAYPPFILASTAAALDWDVSMFFTFYGLNLLQKDPQLHVSALGNPAMPFKMPMGPDWFKQIAWNIPNSFMANVPGFENLATHLMKKTMESKGVASIDQLRGACVESGVKFYACQMTVDLFGYAKESFIDEVTDWVGAATFLPIAGNSDVQLFI